MSQSLFRGSGVALVTPMTPDGIDFPALEQLIEWHIASGTDALILCATTGEGATLTYAERAEIIERSIRQVNGRPRHRRHRLEQHRLRHRTLA